MATIKVKEHSQTQVIMEIDYKLGKDEIILTLDGDNVQVTLTENEEDKANFLLAKPVAQHIFDWLKSKGVVI